ncbi:hypothetical protein ACN4EK_20610, partial [Pantanalinema rosaneae CENA516]|uniref:COG1470 family protein n=1 Tax=Pantanalinema rosaneae TaxID=1620701 RepID=UPI003D6E4D15
MTQEPLSSLGSAMVEQTELTRLEPPMNLPVYAAVAGQGVNLLMLPDRQQALVNWLMQEQSANLLDIAAHLEQDVEATQSLMQLLVEQGFVQDISSQLISSQADLARQRRSVVIDDDRDPTESVTVKPLAVIISPSGDHSATAGSSFEVSVTVFNRGNHSALIDVFIDETAQTLRQWCLSPSERLALGAGQSSEVVFQFQIPPQVLPAIYTYQVVVDAPDHYPEDTPIQFTKRLQVMPLFETGVRVNDPTFTLAPLSSSAQPIGLQPGATLEVKVQVHNRSDRVDRFRLLCPDLERSWFTIRYPEGIEVPGLISSGDGLRLNPGGKGEILLYLTPPIDAPAGIYSPTIRLFSANNPELNLLDVVYVQVSPIHLLNAELKTLISKVRRQPGVYQVRLFNTGNTRRNILLSARSLDEEDAHLFAYTWLDRSGQEIRLPAATPTTNAAVTEADPTVARSLAPALPLQIAAKHTVDVGLQVKPVQWWRRPFFGSGRTANFVVVLEDAQTLPLPSEPLQGTLVWKSRPWWQFLLVLLTGLSAIALLGFAIWWVFFRPMTPPRVLSFVPVSTNYQEAEGKPVRLSWQISNVKRIGKLEILGRSREEGTVLSQPEVYDFNRGIPKQLEELCSVSRAILTCQNVPTEARKSGNYVFELSVFPKGTGANQRQAYVVAKTDPVKISPIAPPKIAQFTGTIMPNVSLTDSVRSFLQAQDATANQNLGDRANLFLLNWRVSQPKQLKELRLVGRDVDGAVTSKAQRYDVSQGLPESLQLFCESANKELVCRNVPVRVTKPGDYVFELAVVPRQGESEPADTKKTDTLKLEPKAPKITAFRINGQEALPKYLVPTKTGKTVKVVQLEWQVEPGEDIKVELLPTPGTVGLNGKMDYPLVQQPGAVTITLQVTNAAGKQVRRSIELQVFDPKASNPPPVPIINIPNLSPAKPTVMPTAAPLPQVFSPPVVAPAPTMPQPPTLIPVSYTHL